MNKVIIEAPSRAERRATAGQRTALLGRHSPSAGTGCVRPQLTKPARIPSGDRPAYTQGEGQH